MHHTNTHVCRDNRVGGSGSWWGGAGGNCEFHMQSPPGGTHCYALTHGPDLTASPAICPPSTGVQLRTRPDRWAHVSAKTTPVGTRVSQDHTGGHTCVIPVCAATSAQHASYWQASTTTLHQWHTAHLRCHWIGLRPLSLHPGVQ